MPAKWEEQDMIVSYLILRRVIGILGVAMPVVLVLWGFALIGAFDVEPSISDYYALRTRDAFVGILFALGCFLLAYKGHDTIDNVMGHLGCVFALGVAVFPNKPRCWQSTLHFVCAVALFLVLAFFSLFLFTKTKDDDESNMTPRKRKRNVVYIACGIAILVCLVLIGLYHRFWDDTPVASLQPVFWLESLVLWAFGISWFVKGETLLKDRTA